MYDEMLVAPMRKELVDAGCMETRSPEAVEAEINKTGSTLVVINSVCGCAAAYARPAVTLALKASKKPDRAITVFAGNDTEATAKARSYFVGYRPSSPAIGLIKNGELVHMVERKDIEGRAAEEIAKDLTSAFEKFL